MSCVKKLARHKKLEDLSKLSKQTIEDVFKKFKPVEQIVEETPTEIAIPKEASNIPQEKELENMIKDIMDMFSHLGDGMWICFKRYFSDSYFCRFCS